MVKKLQEGADMKGNKLIGEAPKFCMGAVVNPGADPLEPQIIKMVDTRLLRLMLMLLRVLIIILNTGFLMIR